MQHYFISFISAILIFIFPFNCDGQNQNDTIRVLFIGNSYTYTENLPQVISVLSESTNKIITAHKSTVGGATLKQHWLGARGLQSIEKIKDGNYHIVVLQEHSMGPINHPDSTLKYIGLFSNIIQKHNAKLLLYETWAREETPERQQQISCFYIDAANRNNGTVVPVGQAWALAKSKQSNIQLYTNDGSHPDKLGTFLTACVFVSAITKQKPEMTSNTILTKDLYGESLILMHLDDSEANFCIDISEKIIKKP